MFNENIFLLTIFTSTAFAYVPNLLHPYSSALIKLNDYDSTVRPPGLNSTDDPVNVLVNFYVRSVESIDQSRNEYKIQITFREEWTDNRLAFKDYDRAVSTNEVQLFWKPDIFFSNERTGHFHTITKPNIFVRINNDGHILLSSRISLTLFCPMALWSFPFDTQFCELRIPSYGYTKNDMILLWKNEEAVQVASNIPIPGYSLKGWETLTCDSMTNTGEYSCLRAIFEFKRQGFPFVIRIFIPLTLLVVASWSSFWLPAAAALPRLTVGSITTLTTALLIFREEDFLRLPSLTSLDIWVGVSAFFVFAAFFEYVLLIFEASRENQQKDSDISEDTEAPPAEKAANKILCITLPLGVAKTDAIAKIAFPVSYLLFHVLFSPFLF